MNMRDNPELDKLLRESVAKFKAMSPTAQEAMMKQQREGYVCAEMSWPKANYKYVDGVKVYASYEDYLND